MILIFIQNILIFLALFYFAYRRGLIFLQIAQQDEYNPKSLKSWYLENKAFDKKASFFALVIFFLCLLVNCNFLINLLGAIALSLISLTEQNPLKSGKLKLNLTNRAKKILLTYLFLTIIALLIIFIISSKFIWLLSIIFFQGIPFLLVVALQILEPYEKNLQKKFFEDAKKIFADSNTFTIGVTGSFGKTSIKNYLGEVLQVSLGSTFWPTEGTNSLMGVTRSIRDNFDNSYKYSVIEMAAYRIGSIAKLCDLCPPKAAIISAIGTQHIDRFGSQENTYIAKTELAKAVPNYGILVVNADNLLAKKAGLEFKKKTTIFYGISDDPEINCKGYDVEITKEGTSFKIKWKNQDYQIQTKLLGIPAVSNLLAVFAMAVSLGANPDIVKKAIFNIAPVKNRLNLEKNGSYYILNDAYNSNEFGFKYALEVLNKIKAPKKILMTPGIIETGDQQFSQNKEIASIAETICDYIIVVSNVNRQAYLEGINNKDKLILVDTREKAFVKLAELVENDCIVLIENDLTDFQETKYKF